MHESILFYVFATKRAGAVLLQCSIVRENGIENMGNDMVVGLSFHDSFQGGSLLAVAYASGVISTYPLYF